MENYVMLYIMSNIQLLMSVLASSAFLLMTIQELTDLFSFLWPQPVLLQLMAVNKAPSCTKQSQHFWRAIKEFQPEEFSSWPCKPGSQEFVVAMEHFILEVLWAASTSSLWKHN